MIHDGIEQSGALLDSVLMLGQSNMAGRGDFGQVKPIRNPMCYMLRMGRWQPMCEPVNPDRAIFDGKFRSGRTKLCVGQGIYENMEVGSKWTVGEMNGFVINMRPGFCKGTDDSL